MSKGDTLRSFMKDIWNDKKVEKIGKYVHEAYEIRVDPGDPWEGKILNHEAFETRLNYSFQSFPDIHFEITSLFDDVDNVGITWILTGTNTGPIGDMSPTNKPIKTTGMTIYHFKDDKICGHTQVYDRSTVMRQLIFDGEQV